MQIKSKNHILIIPSWYPLYPTDIGGSFFREQAIALKKRGMNVGVIFPKAESIKKIFTGFKGTKKEIDEGVTTYRSSYISLPRRKYFNQKRHFKKGVDLFDLYVKENGKPDILHAHSLFEGGLLAKILSEKYNIPFIITEHSTAFSRGLISQKQISDAKLAVSSAACCIAVSNEFKELLNEQLETNKWCYIPNIVSDKFLNIPFKNSNKSMDTFRFINICLLAPKKRVDLLIKAFFLVHKSIKNVELEIGGDGPERDNLIELVNNLGLEHKVKFLGSLTRDSVLQNISKANAFVLSSELETFGVVLVEALALGKPVIATKCGGPESIVTPNVGFLVDKNSAERLAESMILLYKNQDNYNQNEIREYCRSEFSELSVVNRLVRIYDVALSQNSSTISEAIVPCVVLD